MNRSSKVIYQNNYSEKHGKVLINVVKFAKRGKFLLNLSRLFAVYGAAVILGFYSANITGAISSGYGFFSGKNSYEFIQNQEAVLVQDNNNYIPRRDPTLPEENMVLIPTAGIETEINEAVIYNFEEALKKGVWRVSDFGEPDSQGIPTILVAHRFGYLDWGIPYRLKNSFYNLPKTKNGDVVEIIWMQRKYTYIIYEEHEGEDITDYTADLVLYTCKSLNSPQKVFRYAKLLKI